MVRNGMDDPVSLRLDIPNVLISVVGATNERGKYGGKIYRDLKAKGYRVAAVNARSSTVDGDPAFRSVLDLPEPPDIVNIVIPPARTLQLLDEVVLIPDVAVWIQPGAADDLVRKRVHELGIPALMDACIMVRSRERI